MDNKRIDLFWIGEETNLPVWTAGEVYTAQAHPRAVHELISKFLVQSDAEYCLFWDSNLGNPDPEIVREITKRPGDVWHAGLQLGAGGRPHLINFIAPTWMLNLDPPSDIEATCWRISLRACLMRSEVVRQMGGVRPDFITLDGAALEMGHRYVARGVLTRHSPQLLTASKPIVADALPIEDELRFAYYRFGRFWARWALGRALLTRFAPVGEMVKAWRQVSRSHAPAQPQPLTLEQAQQKSFEQTARVSVLIPTLDRPSYLRVILDQLRYQTVAPCEVIVVDQTPVARRDHALTDDFRDLPLKIIYLEQPGQCTSRNAGLRNVKGDYVLFIDDDDEVLPTLIESHLANLRRCGADVSSGVADEAGAGPLPEAFTYLRASDVFPTNNTLIRKDVLSKSGLFDLAYDRGQRADGDLGMRIYLSGAVMILNPKISVVHHHAPAGGLRAHKARVITYASSRQKLGVRHLPSVTEFYLALRYFAPHQVREMFWLRTCGTLSMHGNLFEKTLKFAISLLYLPSTLSQCRKRYRQAILMMHSFPQISELRPERDLQSAICEP